MTSSTSASTAALSETSSFAASRHPRRGQRVDGVGAVGDVGDDDVGAGVAEHSGTGPADASCRAGDDRHAAIEVERVTHRARHGRGATLRAHSPSIG